MALIIKTSDGKEFTDFELAQKHEATIAALVEKKADIEAYMDTLTFGKVGSEAGLKAARGLLSQKILGYLGWVEAGRPAGAPKAEQSAEQSAEHPAAQSAEG